MANDKQNGASNSGADMKAVAEVLAKILVAREVEDYRTQLANAAGAGIAKDQVDVILAKAHFDEDHGVKSGLRNAVRYVLVLGKGWADVERVAKKAVADSKATDTPITGNWTAIANGIAKRRVDEGQTLEAAQVAAVAAAKKAAKADIAKARFARAAKLMREAQADFAASLADDKVKAKLEGWIAGIEKLAA